MGVIDSPPRIETDRLVLRAPVIVMDEPTAALSAAEVNRLAAQSGITLRQLGERTRSLERAFFALTGTPSGDVPDGPGDLQMGAIR